MQGHPKKSKNDLPKQPDATLTLVKLFQALYTVSKVEKRFHNRVVDL